MLTARLLAITALLSLLGAPLAERPPGRATVLALPAEPEAQVLTDAPTLQAVVADLDADGAREIVALTADADGSVDLRAWSVADGAWAERGAPVTVAPSDEPATSALRLVVRSTSDGERATLLRVTPIDGPPPTEPCCLHVADVVSADGRIAVQPVAELLDAFDAAFVLDLDGDGVDELFASRSLLPLGDVSYPTAAAVLRWDGHAFGSPLSLELPVGSGDTPFVLGETDGEPGEELGLLATIGRPAFYRLTLVDGSRLRVEDSRLVPLPADVAAVDLGGRRGLAVLSTDGVLELRAWPANEPIGPREAWTRARFANELLGEVSSGGRAFVALRQASGTDTLHLRELPRLNVPPSSVLPVGPAAPAFGAAPVSPYVGPIPAGTASDGPTVLVGGRLVVVGGDPSTSLVARVGLAAGAAPVGRAGPGDGWVALVHLPAATPPDPRGGRLDVVRPTAGSGITVAPFEAFASPEADGATFVPPTAGAIATPAGALRVGPGGFSVRVDAPPGSRVHVAGLDPTVTGSVVVVGPSGRADVPMPPPATGVPNPNYRASLAVTTPAGHSYAASWDVRVATEPPELDAVVTTPLGSVAAVVRGTAPPDTDVTVDGRTVPVAADGRFETSVPVPPWPTEVVVTATDPFGTESRRVLSAVGVLDYRGLPWLPIVGAGVALVAIILAIRIPTRAVALRADDDAALEELDDD